jgi:hypothetical protein
MRIGISYRNDPALKRLSSIYDRAAIRIRINSNPAPTAVAVNTAHIPIPTGCNVANRLSASLPSDVAE